jgi:curved DNA-binding protein CbpA
MEIARSDTLAKDARLQKNSAGTQGNCTVMDGSKDYYAVLGVLPSIEPAAIRAVYLALLKKYNPDIYKGTKEEAVRRTKEFNEAYDVLGDDKKREEYDRLRDKSTGQSGDYKNEARNEAEDDSDSETLSRWQYVVDYYPEIQSLYTSIAKVSPALAFSYRIALLERKLSGERHNKTSIYYGTRIS